MCFCFSRITLSSHRRREMAIKLDGPTVRTRDVAGTTPAEASPARAAANPDAAAADKAGAVDGDAFVRNVKHAEGRFNAPDGTSLFEQSWKPATGQPKGVLIIVHGLKDHSSRYAETAEK